MRWAFVCYAHKRAATPPMKEQSKTCGFAAGLPSTIFNCKKGNSRVASAAGVPEPLFSFFYNCFYTINCQNRGSYYIVSPNFGREYNCEKNSLLSSQTLLFSGTPARSAGGSFLRFGAQD